MRNRRYGIFAAGFVILVATLVTAPALAFPAYAGVANSTVTVTSNPPNVEFMVTALANIPRHADSYINSHLAFGYAWIEPETPGVEADTVWAIIHPNLADDSAFANPQDWHAHTAKINSTLNTVEPYCVTQINSPNFTLKINGKKLTENLAPSDATITSDATTTSFVLDAPVNVTCPDIVLNGVTQPGFQLVFRQPP